MNLPAAISLLILLLAAPAVGQVRSVYTKLDERSCKKLKTSDDEGGSYLGECPGYGRFKLQVIEGDLRQSVNVVFPDGSKSELDLWNVSGGFSSLGPAAEWRLKGKELIALIFRFNVSEDPEDASKLTSYLVVVKLEKGTACVTEAIRPTRSQNADARRAADKARSRPCRFQQQR